MKKIIILILLVIFSSFVYGDLTSDLQLHMLFNNSLWDNSSNNFNSSFYILGYAGYDFILNQNSNDIWGSQDGSDTNIVYNQSGANFNGTSRITIGTTTDFSDFCNNGCSVAAWTRPTRVSGSTIVARFRDSGSDKFFAFYEWSSNRKNVVIHANGATSPLSQELVNTGYQANTLYHQGFSFNGSNVSNGTVSVYQDGVFQGEADNSVLIDSAGWQDEEDTIIGDDQAGAGSWPYNGSMEGIFLYQRNMSTEEFSILYNKGNYTNNIIGSSNESLTLNGVDQYVVVQNSTLLRSTNMTVSFWFNKSIDTESQMVVFGNSGSSRFVIGLNINSSLFIHDDISNDGQSYYPYAFSNNTWYMVSLVGYENGTKDVYVNGSYVSSFTNSNFSLLDNPIITIGRNPIGGNYFHGKLDNLRIYNRSLTEDEITNLYNNESVQPPNVDNNFDTNQTTASGSTFSVDITTNYYDEDANCTVLDTSSTVNCSNVTISSPNYNGTTTCSVTSSMNELVYFVVQCDSPSYPLVNSTNESITINNIYPSITLTSPLSTNLSYQHITDTFTFDWVCNKTGYVNITSASILCSNQSDDQVFSYSTTFNNNSYSNGNTTQNFSYVNNFECRMRCTDSDGLQTDSYGNISVVDLNISKSNISSIRQSNSVFTVNQPFDFNGDSANCSLVANDTSVVNCTDYSGSSPAVFTCTPQDNKNSNVTFVSYCNDTTRTHILNINTTPSAEVMLDTVDPAITIISWTANKTYFRQNITGNFTFQDNLSLYRWNVTVDNVSIASAVNPAYDSYTYNMSIDPQDYSTGIHYLYIEVADGHTSNEIPDYRVKRGGVFRNDYLEFRTPDENKITIEAKDRHSGDNFDYTRKLDRYEFTYKPERDETRRDITSVNDGRGQPLTVGDVPVKKVSMKVRTDKPLHIINRPNTPWKKWLVSGNQWIDFFGDNLMNNTRVNYYYDLSTEDPNDVIVDVYYHGDLNEPLRFSSVGDLNVVNYSTTFYTINSTSIYVDPVNQGSVTEMKLIVNISGSPLGFANISSNLTYNGSIVSSSKTSSSDLVNWTASVTAPNVTSDQVVNFTWNITVDGEGEYLWNLSHNVYFIGVTDNCSEPGYIQALEFCGYDEDNLSLNISDMRLNLNLDILDDTGAVTKKFGFEFDGSTCYPICISPNTTTYQANAKMEYGDGNYTDRKYYLNNVTLSNVSTNITLYHLLDSRASDVILTTYDKTSGERITDAYVKVLRYYPGLDNETGAAYKTVEVELSDVNGEGLSKMVLADVWYKFIVEKPAGTVLLNTDIEKILTTDKLLPIVVSAGNLLDFNSLLNIAGEVECVSSTKTCTFTWSNPSGADVDGTLLILQDTGFKKINVYEQTITSSAATIAYTIPGNTTGKYYIAEGWVSQ